MYMKLVVSLIILIKFTEYSNQAKLWHLDLQKHLQWDLGPGELLQHSVKKEKVLTRGRRSTPVYMQNLHQRHQNSWMNMERFQSGHQVLGDNNEESVGNLGPVTAIRQHKYFGSESLPNMGPYQINQETSDIMSFSLLTNKGNNETLVEAQLRFKFNGDVTKLGLKPCNPRSEYLKINITILGQSRPLSDKAIFEPEDEYNCQNATGWINIPMTRTVLKNFARTLASNREKRVVHFRLSLQGLEKQSTHISEEGNEPHLLTFHRDDKLLERVKSRPSRSLNNQSTLGNDKKEKSQLNKGRRIRATSKLRNERIHQTCQRRDLMVNFHKVGWSSWVLAPLVYNAGYCWGHCPFPLSSHYNATNHAIIMYLAHNSKTLGVQPPCCVAHSFSPLSMIHLDQNNGVVMEIYEDMVVDGCSCR